MQDKQNPQGFRINLPPESAKDDIFEKIEASLERERYEDIVSDSRWGSGSGDLSSHSSGKHAQTAGKRGVFARIGAWWRSMKRWQKATVASLTALILVLVLLVSVVFGMFRYNYNPITKDPEDLGFTEIINKKIVNIALFGIDTREKGSFQGLSDSIMILSLNTQTKKVKVISVMRDSLVPIEQNGKTTYNKITTAYSKGGPELAIKTLNRCFGLDISEYATVNFYGMADIIDAVGGIDATLTQREVTARGENNHGINDMIDELCQYLGYRSADYYVTTPGEKHLNGVQAVAYARIRYVANIWGTNNDYGRTDRQRYVMEQLFSAAVKMNKSQYIKLAKALIPCSQTSLSYGDIMGLAVNILLHSPTFEQARIPQDNFQMSPPSGSFGSVVYYDLDYAANAVHAMIYDDMTIEAFVAENPIAHNDWYRKAMGGGSGSSGKKPVSSEPETPPEKTVDPVDPSVKDPEKTDDPSEPEKTDDPSEPETPDDPSEPEDPSSPEEPTE